MRRASRLALAPMVLALSGLLLAGCGQEESGGDTPEPRAPVVDDLGKHDGKPCPATLPESSGDGAVAGKPEVPAFDRAWVCRYQVESWTLEAGPTAVAAADLARLETLLGGLEPAPADQMCTMDLGPRYLLVLADDTDLTGVVVEAYGCRNARIAADPHEPAGGAPYVAPGLLEELTRIGGAA